MLSRHAGARLLSLGIATLAMSPGAGSMTSIQIGASGKTYASGALECGVHPSLGMAPRVQAGLYDPKRNASGTVSLGDAAIASVSFLAPDTTVWLANGSNAVEVALNRRVGDVYTFDAAIVFPAQPNVCIPDTRGNSVAGDIEYAQSLKSYATLAPGCALNAATGVAQPYVNLFDNGPYLLNVSINNVPLTQLNGTTRVRTPVFLGPGLNVISAMNGAASTDHYVRDGASGRCALP
jgi:hypothetical protein